MRRQIQRWQIHFKALERAKESKEAHGEIEIEHLGYYTYYVENDYRIRS